ncbi:MAG: IS4 family transposase [Lachnospiraceae bacterium]|nr:IS4 family transposase [Lachnospiraceae bacterium]MDD6965808.1 IS4 family transposase [Bacillota bacterium]
MNDFPTNVKEKLNSIISDMAERHWLFSSNPRHDFMRQDLGKLSFYDTMRMIIGMGKGSTNDEIMDYFDLDPDCIPSQSAFCQRRSQISLSAFEYLFSEFSSSFPRTTNKFKDHCILACDGCHVVYTTNSEIIEDYNIPRLIDYKGYNHMHLNGFVDVISKAFLDIVIQPGQHPDEREAFHTMLDHFQPDDPEKYIITADRGYESYDLLFHCELKHLNYVFRMKAPSSSKSLLSSYISELPDDQEEFDVTIKRFSTDKYTSIMKDQSDVYHYMNPYKNIPHFQQLLNDKHLYFMQFRVVKIKVAENTYEYMITNLPHTFVLEDIKACYHWRWGIEISFRYLKHANGLLYFHSKKPEFLKQEIYANLILYNFGIFLANEAAEENLKKKRKKGNKYNYEIDFSSALKTARKFFVRRDSHKHVDIIKLMMKYVHAVKIEFRKFDRPLRGIGAIHFGYR